MQDPKDAAFPGMPGQALAAVEVDYCLPLDEIAGTLARLVRRCRPRSRGRWR